MLLKTTQDESELQAHPYVPQVRGNFIITL